MPNKVKPYQRNQVKKGMSKMNNLNLIVYLTTIIASLGIYYSNRAVARSENPGELVVQGGENVPPWLR